MGDPAALLSRRSDVAAAERELAATTARIGVQVAGLYPQIELQGSIGIVAGSLDAMSGGGALSSLIGQVIRWSLFDTGRVLAHMRFAAGEGIYLDVLEAERLDFASRSALAVARTRQRLAVVSIYKALGGGWEPCTQAGQDCSGAAASSLLSVQK